MEFFLKVVLSFLVGGSYVVTVILLSEKVSSRAGAALAGMPSTILIGLIFIILANGTAAGRDALAIIPLMFSATLLYALVFVYLAKLNNMMISISLATIAWLAYSSAVKQLDFLSFAAITLIGVTSLALFRIGFTNFKSVDAKKVSLPHKINFLRFLAGGTIIAGSVLAAHYLDATWGGIIASFPALLGVVLYFLNKSQGSNYLLGFIKNLPLSYVSSLLFVIIVHQTLGHIHPAISIVLGMACAGIYTYTISSLKPMLEK